MPGSLHELPIVAPDKLEFFVPVRLVSRLNRREHWALSAHRARKERDAVALACWEALGRTTRGRQVWRFVVPPSRPKIILFVAYLGRGMDDDNLRGAVKSVRDGLQDAGVIDDDGPLHRFLYEQRTGIPPAERGVRVCIGLRP